MEPADCDFDDFVYNEEPIITEATVEKVIPSQIKKDIFKVIPGYKIAGIFHKKIYDSSKGTKCIPGHIKYFERNKAEPEKYSNPLFNEWQNNLITGIHEGNNIIARVATSCGKTWATNSIISWYTLSGGNTALFITPNYEIMTSNVKEILEKNYKIYLHPGSKIIDTQTRRFSTYTESEKSLAQILCITADNFTSFVTNDVNYEFIKKLKYIVFDEVHLPIVSSSIRWAGLLPHNAQYILLSATISDSDIDTFSRHLSLYSDKLCTVISYGIRPIPLQYLFLHHESGHEMLCQINIEDPTKRDIKKMLKMKGCTEYKDLEHNMPREEYYALGQRLIEELKPQVIEGITEAIKKAEVEVTTERIYNLLKYLFKKDMQPVIIFGITAMEVKDLCSDVCSYINYLEANDAEHIKLCKTKTLYEKLEADMKKKLTRSTAEELEELNFEVDNLALNKYRFPIISSPIYLKSGLEKTALDYGIGINIGSMKSKIKSKIFEMFKEGKIKVLFADSSISVGINLPIRTCILTDSTGMGISKSLFKQMSGRAGRRGFDNQGYIIPMFSKSLCEKYLTEVSYDENSIVLSHKLSGLELTKLVIPEYLSNYYNSSSDYVIPPPHNKATISKLRKAIIDRFNAIFPDEKRFDYIKQNSLHNNTLTNIIGTSIEPATFIFIQLIITGFPIKNDTDMIKVIATLLHRKKGSCFLLSSEELKLIDSYDIDNICYTAGITDWLCQWYSGKFTKEETRFLYTELTEICDWIYNLTKHFNKISITPTSMSTIKTILKETDRKFVNMMKMSGIFIS